MNNPDLRRIIFSFFRGKDYKVCQKCKIPCQWKEGVKNTEFVEWGNFINCHKCFREGYLGTEIVFKYPLT